MEKQTARQSDHKFWRVHIEAWRNSGLTQSEYCRQRQISRDAFAYWKKRLPPELKADDVGNLVPIPFRLPFPERVKLIAPLGIVVGDRFRLEINTDFDPALLEKALLALARIS